MLKIEGVHKVFYANTVNERRALCGVCLHLQAGEFVCLIGSNGAGKSTLLNALCGDFQIDQGHIVLNGRNITHWPNYKRAREIGRMFQDPMRGTAPAMTVEENLALAYLRASRRRRPLSMLSRQDRVMLQERLAQLHMGLENCMRQPVQLLSGGQRQALTLLMATVVTPKLLLLDEHTAALDPTAAQRVLALTQEIVQGQGITCLMITHQMDAALKLGSRTVMMNRGEVVLDIQGEKRRDMTPADLMQEFRRQTGEQLTDDRLLLSGESNVSLYNGKGAESKGLDRKGSF